MDIPISIAFIGQMILVRIGGIPFTSINFQLLLISVNFKQKHGNVWPISYYTNSFIYRFIFDSNLIVYKPTLNNKKIQTNIKAKPNKQKTKIKKKSLVLRCCCCCLVRKKKEELNVKPFAKFNSFYWFQFEKHRGKMSFHQLHK